MQSDVPTIKDRLNIVDVVGEYVRLTKTGSNFKACCPFHDEKSPSFVVTEERGSYHCFGCGKGGDIFSFIMEIEGMEFREALELLAARAGVELQKFTPAQQKARDEKSGYYKLMDLSVKLYHKQLVASKAGKSALAYLHDRGITDATIAKFNIGYAPNEWHFAETFSTHKGFTRDVQTKIGLIIQKDHNNFYDRFRHRVMFPISDVLGRPIGYSARVMPTDDDAGAKYINTPESPLYHKSDILFGIDLAKRAIKSADQVVLVEGNMDVVAAHEAGIENVVAVSGTALTTNHIKILKRYTNHFILFFDADNAGQQAARKSAQMCLTHDVRFSLVSLEHGKDAADLVRENPTLLADAIRGAKDSLTFFLQKARQDNNTNDPHGKRTAVEDVLSLASHVSHPIEQAQWLSRTSEALDVDTVVANDILQRFISDNKPKTKSAYQKTTTQDKDAVTRTPQAKQEKSELERIVSEIVKIALAFPSAWKQFARQAESYPFYKKQKMLTVLAREGPDLDHDALTFLEKYAADSSQKYKTISAFREEFSRSRGEQEVADSEILTLAARGQELQRKATLDELTKQLKEAEKSRDTKKKKEIMQQISDLSHQPTS